MFRRLAALLFVLVAGSSLAAEDPLSLEIDSLRLLAENDAPEAHARTVRLYQSQAPQSSRAEKAAMLTLLARTEIYLARPSEAETHALEALEISSRDADSGAFAAAELPLILVYLNQGRIDDMYRATSQAFSHIDGVHQPDVRSEILLMTVLMQRRMGKLDESLTLALHGVDQYKDTGHPLALAYAYKALGLSLMQSEHYAEAKDAFAKMRDEARRAPSKLLEAEALGNGATVEGNLGNLAAAELLSKESLRLYRSIGAPFSIIQGLLNLADNLHKQKRDHEVLPILDEALSQCRQHPNRITFWYTLQFHSAVAQSLGNKKVPLADAEEAYALAKEIGATLYISESARQWATLEAARGNFEKAYRLASESTRVTAEDDRKKVATRTTELIQKYSDDTRQRQILDLTKKTKDQEGELIILLVIVVGGFLVTLVIGGLGVRLLVVQRSERAAREELIASETQTRWMAYHDEMTGLPNRRKFREAAMERLGEALLEETPLAVVFLDIDHFKKVNDAHGHTIGDILLMSVVEKVGSVLQDDDQMFHFVGDKYILLLPRADQQRATLVVNRVKEAMDQSHSIAHAEFFLTASMGVALYPDHADNLDALVRNAEVAMYQSKRAGRNASLFYTPAHHTRSLRNVHIESALHQALEKGEFSLVYQPQVSLEDGALIGVEALVRWTHPELGTVSPAEFIPLAEESGHILSMGEWVLAEAVGQLRLWHDQGFSSLVMAVNLSVTQFKNPDLPSTVARILKEAGVAPSCLELEITESVAMGDVGDVVRIIDSLNGLGIRLAMDDFGTGYSSLSYLKRFQFDKLKIDQSFVRDLPNDAHNLAIVRAIISVASSLGLRTIAEGVETHEQWELLREEGCHEGQGYLFSHPVSQDSVELFLKKGGFDVGDCYPQNART